MFIELNLWNQINIIYTTVQAVYYGVRDRQWRIIMGQLYTQNIKGIHFLHVFLFLLIILQEVLIMFHYNYAQVTSNFKRTIIITSLLWSINFEILYLYKMFKLYKNIWQNFFVSIPKTLTNQVSLELTLVIVRLNCMIVSRLELLYPCEYLKRVKLQMRYNTLLIYYPLCQNPLTSLYTLLK